MTTHAHPEPIRLPVIREFDTGSGVFQQIDGYLFVTPDIARQIVAMVLPEDMRRMCADLDVAKLEARIAALEARAQSQDRVDDTIGALLMPPPVEVPPGQRSRNPILDNYTQPAAPDRVCSECGGTPVICQQRRCYGFMNGHTKPGQPAAPDADEAAVDAIAERCFGPNNVARSVLCARYILADIRSGAIRLPEDAPQIAALRAKLAEQSEAMKRMHAEADAAASRTTAILDALGVVPPYRDDPSLYDILKAMAQSATEADALRSEVEALRGYGNKDCTAMADAEIARKAAGAEVAE